jgi:hypothetical protein
MLAGDDFFLRPSQELVTRTALASCLNSKAPCGPSSHLALNISIAVPWPRFNITAGNFTSENRVLFVDVSSVVDI